MAVSSEFSYFLRRFDFQTLLQKSLDHWNAKKNNKPLVLSEHQEILNFFNNFKYFPLFKIDDRKFLEIEIFQRMVC